MEIKKFVVGVGATALIASSTVAAAAQQPVRPSAVQLAGTKTVVLKSTRSSSRAGAALEDTNGIRGMKLLVIILATAAGGWGVYEIIDGESQPVSPP